MPKGKRKGSRVTVRCQAIMEADDCAALAAVLRLNGYCPTNYDDRLAVGHMLNRAIADTLRKALAQMTCRVPHPDDDMAF